MEHTSTILFDIFVVIVAAKAAALLFEYLRQPPVMGELLVGMLLGAHVLGIIQHAEFLEALAEIGIIILLFKIGLEVKLDELKKVGGQALLVAILGIIIPFFLCFLVMKSLNFSLNHSILVGLAMIPTSIGITMRVIADLGLLKTQESKIVLGAAIIDDIMAMLLLALGLGFMSGHVKGGEISILLLEAVGFIVFVFLLRTQFGKVATLLVEGCRSKIGDSSATIALVLCLGLAVLAHTVGLAAFIGAFLAGMIFSESCPRYHIEEKITPFYDFVVPFFFFVIGMKIDPGVFTNKAMLLVTVLIIVAAVLGKLLAGIIGAHKLGRTTSFRIGLGMIPRGEVVLVVAAIALHNKIIGSDIYTIMAAVVLFTTLSIPPTLRWAFGNLVHPPQFHHGLDGVEWLSHPPEESVEYCREEQKKKGSPIFTVSDILDWPAFLVSLKEPEKPAIRRIWEFMGEESQKIIESCRPNEYMDKKKKQLVIDGLNTILSKKDFFDGEAFENIKIKESGLTLLAKGVENLSKVEVQKLNRFLFESVYPDDNIPEIKTLTKKQNDFQIMNNAT